MIRYAIKVDDRWYALGTKFNSDIQFAHLFSTLALAQRKAEYYIHRIPRWYKDVQIVPFQMAESF